MGTTECRQLRKVITEKDLKDLSLPSIGTPCGMPLAPNQYDPYSHPEAAQQRRNLVLKKKCSI